MTNSFPHIIKGDIFNDNRGKLLSCNLFDMSRVKRMYSILKGDKDFNPLPKNSKT